jgi:phosphatidate phosphatase APP1
VGRGYANWTNSGWSLRIHGQAYKEPLSNTTIVPTSALDDATNVFLPDLDVSQLNNSEKANARNLTSAVLSIPQDNVQLQFVLDVSPAGAHQNFTSDWTARIIWPQKTDSQGEFNGWVPLPITPPGQSQPWLPLGNETKDIVKLDVRTNGTDTGNATAYLVPPEGVLIVSDIDDILRVTKIYEPQQGLLNTFARNFTPWLNMPVIYSNWSNQHPDQPYHFHYLTTTPEQATRAYMNFIYNTYPLGSFDTRPLNFTTVDQTFSVRKTLLDTIFQTFPSRKFVLVGDTTNSDVMRDYPDLAKLYGNVQCILLRNTSNTDSGDNFPYDTSHFKGLDTKTYMFFNTPDDLMGLDLGNGDCVNSSVKQGLTFGWQNLPLGIKDQGSDGTKGVGGAKEKVWWLTGAAVGMVVWGGLW